jgi:RNA recognition motif-containing protein
MFATAGFEVAGEVKYNCQGKSRGFGIVTFKTVPEALRAIKVFDGCVHSISDIRELLITVHSFVFHTRALRLRLDHQPPQPPATSPVDDKVRHPLMSLTGTPPVTIRFSAGITQSMPFPTTATPVPQEQKVKASPFPAPASSPVTVFVSNVGPILCLSWVR